MPIFEFVCKSCESKFETLVMNADEHVNCKCCGSENLEKQFSSFAAHNSTTGSPDTGSMPSTGGGCCGGGCACGH